MKLYEKEIFIPLQDSKGNLLEYFSKYISSCLSKNEILIRFVITKTDNKGYYCELEVLSEADDIQLKNSIFDFNKRNYKNNKNFNAVLIIPAGIDAEIGGHSGDGNAVAKLIASACDNLITHPNVVNAADINEMTENTLYVEGSILTRFLMGQIGLQKVYSNKILMLMDKHRDKLFNDEIINAVSAARATLGIDCDVYEMKEVIDSTSVYSKSGRCVGEIKHLDRLIEILKKYRNKYDAFGLSTLIKVPNDYNKRYFNEDDMVNPWGGVEAMLSHTIAQIFDIPCAHSPMIPSREIMNIELGIVDPRKAPETSSVTSLHCILKGLHKSPRVISYDKGLNVEDVSCLIIPDKCIGLPTLAALEQNIPVIAVKENKNIMSNNLENLPWNQGQLIFVENYLEAVGVMNALRSGISLESVKRPLKFTKIID